MTRQAIKNRQESESNWTDVGCEIWTCVHVGEAKNERVRESVNPLGGCTRPFGYAEADARQLTRVVWSAFFRETQASKRPPAEMVSLVGCKTRALVMCLQLLTAVDRYVYFVTQAAWAWVCLVQIVQGEDTGCYWSHRDFWPTPVGPPSRSSLAACVRLWVEGARRRSGPRWVKSNKKKRDYILLRWKRTKIWKQWHQRDGWGIEGTLEDARKCKAECQHRD